MNPAQSGTGVHGSLLRLVDVVEHQGGVKVLADVVRALLSLLPAPCGVVELVAGKVDGLLHGGLAIGVAARIHPECECERMVLVEHLLAREEETACSVECAGHHAFVGITSDGRNRQSQAVGLHTGGVGGHGAILVVGVGVAECSVEARSVAFGDCREVLAAADVAEAVACSAEANGGCGVAERARGHAGKLLEGESAAHKVVHRERVDVRVTPHAVVTAVVGVQRRIAVTAEAEIDIIVRAGEGVDALRVSRLVVEHGLVEK